MYPSWPGSRDRSMVHVGYYTGGRIAKNEQGQRKSWIERRFPDSVKDFYYITLCIFKYVPWSLPGTIEIFN